ncbi:MAG: orotidine 5'-phosphate decarboxylase [Myxococcales bacterium]|nr:orotidine 5'-phosphate decarboxylase [Myxococcales bacterium]
MFALPRLSRLAVELEAPNFEPLEPLLDDLEDKPVLAAVGAPLMTAVGPSVVQHLRHSGLETLFDLRLFDEPERAALVTSIAVRNRGVGITVQLGAGEQMVQAVMRAAKGRIPVVGILAPRWLPQGDVVGANARLAARLRLAGVMGTPAQLGAIAPDSTLPLRWVYEREPTDVQATIRFVSEACRVGATTTFVGRTVLQSSDPGTVIDGMLRTTDHD